MKSLTRDDFTLFDQGKPQPITVFGAGRSSDAKSSPLPPGAVSNRLDSRGQPLNGATAVLVDLLNTSWLATDYVRLGMKEFLRSLGETDNRIALYSLGKDLHILHDFTDDPQKLTAIGAQLAQPHGKLPPEIARALADYGDLLGLGGGDADAHEVHDRITVKALRRIVQHLSGVPGRKSLVWVTGLTRIPAPLMVMLQQANVVLYPVGSGLASLESEYATRELGTASGGRAFLDARDLIFAVRTAEQDTHGAYVLGYYPAEDALDGKFHKITVKLRNKDSAHGTVEIHYRSGYLATKAALPPPAPTGAELLEGQLDLTGIGLSAQATPEPEHPGLYDVNVTVDLHDIHLDRKDGHFAGSFVLYFPNPSLKDALKTGTVAVNLTSEQLGNALENGLTRIVKGIESDMGEIHVVVRDRATGMAGSLRVPVATE